MEMTAIKAKLKALTEKPLVFTVLVLMLAVAGAYLTHSIARLVGVDRTVTANDEYLDSSLKKSGSAFVTLSAIKAGVSVIEGSTIGVGAGVTANVEVGDAVQSILDFVDMAWKITFFSVTTLFIVKMVLIQISGLGFSVLMIAFVSGALLLSIRAWKRNDWILSGVVRRVFWFFMMCSVGIYIALPLSVGIARVLSQKISAPSLEAGLETFTELQHETSSAAMNERLFPEGEKIKDKFNLKKKIGEITEWCADMGKRLFESGIRYCAGFMFDCILFPGALIITVWAVVKKGLAGQHISNRRTLREDLAYALKKLKREQSGEEERQEQSSRGMSDQKKCE